MKGKLSALFAVAIFIASVMVVVIADDTDAAPESKVTGIVGQQGNSGMEPAKDAIISFKFVAPGSTQESTVTAKTNAEGIFIAKLPFTDTSVKVVLGCEVAGHTIFTVPECVTYDSDKDEFSFTLDALGAPDASGNYVLSSHLTSSIVISDAKVQVEITVTGNSGPVNGAEVSIYNGQKKVASGYTDYRGICKFSSPILLGTYELKIVCEGCENFVEKIDITKTATQFSTNIEEKGVPTVLGLTAYHILMVFGVIIGLILVVVAYVLSSRTWKGLE